MTPMIRHSTMKIMPRLIFLNLIANNRKMTIKTMNNEENKLIFDQQLWSIGVKRSGFLK